MKLKNQILQGIDPWPGVRGKRPMSSIARLVVMNDGKQQTHMTTQSPWR